MDGGLGESCLLDPSDILDHLRSSQILVKGKPQSVALDYLPSDSSYEVLVKCLRS